TWSAAAIGAARRTVAVAIRCVRSLQEIRRAKGRAGHNALGLLLSCNGLAVLLVRLQFIDPGSFSARLAGIFYVCVPGYDRFVIVLSVHKDAGSDVLLVTYARNGAGLLTGLREYWEENCSKDRYNRDNNKQFYERKRSLS